MNDHFRPVGKPAPPRPRRPDAFISLMMPSRPLSRMALVPSQAPRRARALEAPVVEAVEVLEDAVLVVEHVSLSDHRLDCCRRARRRSGEVQRIGRSLASWRLALRSSAAPVWSAAPDAAELARLAA